VNQPPSQTPLDVYLCRVCEETPCDQQRGDSISPGVYGRTKLPQGANHLDAIDSLSELPHMIFKGDTSNQAPVEVEDDYQMMAHIQVRSCFVPWQLSLQGSPALWRRDQPSCNHRSKYVYRSNGEENRKCFRIGT
jgi:hypothetical protein